jgi:hypothetical protein
MPVVWVKEMCGIGIPGIGSRECYSSFSSKYTSPLVQVIQGLVNVFEHVLTKDSVKNPGAKGQASL